MSSAARYFGKLRIKEMESVDDEMLELDGEVCLVVERSFQGRSGFGGIRGWIDCRSENVNALERLAFSSEGTSGRRSSSGRGRGVHCDGESAARAYIHNSDEPSSLAFPLVEEEV